MMTITPNPMMNPPVADAGFCATVHNGAAKSINWITDNSKAFAASAGETLSRMWAAVSEFFSNMMSTIGSWLATARDTMVAGKDQFMAMPTQGKWVVAVGAAALVLTSCLFARCICGGSTPATTQQTTQTTQQTNTQPANTQANTQPANTQANTQPANTQANTQPANTQANTQPANTQPVRP